MLACCLARRICGFKFGEPAKKQRKILDFQYFIHSNVFNLYLSTKQPGQRYEIGFGRELFDKCMDHNNSSLKKILIIVSDEHGWAYLAQKHQWKIQTIASHTSYSAQNQ